MEGQPCSGSIYKSELILIRNPVLFFSPWIEKQELTEHRLLKSNHHSLTDSFQHADGPPLVPLVCPIYSSNPPVLPEPFFFPELHCYTVG